jgi:hypothetical protein
LNGEIMRLIGKQQDYYDSALGHGYDPHVTYVRKPLVTERDEISDHPIFRPIMNKYSDEIATSYSHTGWHKLPSAIFEAKLTKGRTKDINIDPGFIGFCGKIYPFIVLSWNIGAKNIPGSDYVPEHTEERFCYNIDTLENEFSKWNINFKAERDTPQWLKKRGVGRDRDWGRFTRKNAEDFLIVNENIDLFFEIGNPTFAMYCHENGYRRQNWKILENPILKDFQFYRVFDAYTAFQELSMFLGGVLGGAHPPMVEISNDDMARKKGFGHKYAFRKEPESK